MSAAQPEPSISSWDVPSPKQIARSILCACLLASACLLIRLGHKPLADWDEAIYAGIAKAMLRGPILTETWHFQNFMEKPPLYMWLTAGLFHVFGVNEFWARFISALSAIGVVTIAHGIVAQVRGLRAAWLTTFVLLTMKGFEHAGRVGELDMLLAFGCFLSLWGIHRMRAGCSSGWYLVWTGFAVAVMTKSAAAALIPATVIVLIFWENYWEYRPDPSRVWTFGKEFFAGTAIFLVLAAPWHLYMTHRFGTAFWREYLGVQVFSRSTAKLDQHNNPPWFYLGVLIVYAMPWLLLVPAAVIRGLKKRELREFTIFALVTLLLYSLAKTRLPQYIVPVYPALAVMTGDWMLAWIEAAGPARRRRLQLGAGFVVAALTASSFVARPAANRLLNRSGNYKAEQAGKWLVPLLSAGSSQTPADPILLCEDGDWMPLPSAVFYTGRHLQQVYIQEKPDTSRQAHRYYADPQPLKNFVDYSPRLIVIDKATAQNLPSVMMFHQLREGGPYLMGTIALRSGTVGPATVTQPRS